MAGELQSGPRHRVRVLFWLFNQAQGIALKNVQSEGGSKQQYRRENPSDVRLCLWGGWIQAG